MCKLTVALLCLLQTCVCLAAHTPASVTPSVTATRPAVVTLAELAQLNIEGVAVREVSDYVFGGYRGDFPSPPHADLNPKKAFIIFWKDFPFRFVFSHEASYCPWLELPSGAAVSYQFFEGNLGWAELFNTWGRLERNSFVEILEPGPDRVWVRWTYFGVNMRQGQPAYRGTEDFWAYPNGLIVRRQVFDSLLPGDHHGYAREPIELIGLCPVGKRWCDVLRQVPGSDERHALAVLDVYSDKRYDVFWTPLTGTVWDSTHRRSGCAWQDLDDAPGVIMGIPMTDGTPFCAFGDNSGFRHDYTRLKDHTFVAEVWGSSCWDHWPIGWLNSQGHVVDADSLKLYPNHFSPLGMDFFALANDVVARGEFYSILGVSGDNWEATRTSVKQWLEKAERVATPDSGADLPAVWTPYTETDTPPVRGNVDQVGNEIRPGTARDVECSPQVPLDYGQVVQGFQDDFSSVVRDPNWVAVPADCDCYRQADGVLRVTTMDANPSHLLYQAAGYNGAAQEVLARIRVRASAPGPSPIGGISVVSSPEAAHAGEAINLVFLQDPGDCLGVAGPVLRLVDDWRAWGPAVPDFVWETDAWYWLRLGQTGANTGKDTNIRAKVWRADGTEPEPADWQIDWARDGRTGFAGICGPHDGSPAEFEVDYMLLKADGLPRIQVAPEACSPRKTVVIREDVHVRERMEWRDADYQIHGHVIFHEGSELVVEHATVSLMCTYTREFRYQWEGGTLVTRNVTIGGAKKDGIVYQTYFEIQDGAWESEDTTIEYS